MRVLGEKFIATLQCFVRNLLMYQNGKACVFFIKMSHSINPICRKDTGGDSGTQLRKLSLLSLGPVLYPGSGNGLSPVLCTSLLPWKRAGSPLPHSRPQEEKPRRRGVEVRERLPSESD